ncbi:MAG: 5'/3'-nucleotidase SurE [Deltaproteobacteria bacterium]|nr:5'/3'-nucleotidase SurE [Deltaproteobacteria bacterium]
MSEKPLILVTNDDGIRAAGLEQLAAAAATLGDVWVVAPESEQSAMAHALTLHHPLRIREYGPQTFSVDGTPTDCVFFAALHICPRKPDLVLSGVNRGANVGDDVTYSGTVSAALEGVIMGFPGVAVSLVITHDGPRDYAPASKYAVELARDVLRRGLPDKVYLNINVPQIPAEEIKGVRVTTLGHRMYDDRIIACEDPRGKPYYWIGGKRFEAKDIPGSDCNAVLDGYISVTPLHANPTDYGMLEELRGWELERG